MDSSSSSVHCVHTELSHNCRSLLILLHHHTSLPSFYSVSMLHYTSSWTPLYTQHPPPSICLSYYVCPAGWRHACFYFNTLVVLVPLPHHCCFCRVSFSSHQTPAQIVDYKAWSLDQKELNLPAPPNALLPHIEPADRELSVSDSPKE